MKQNRDLANTSNKQSLLILDKGAVSIQRRNVVYPINGAGTTRHILKYKERMIKYK